MKPFDVITVGAATRDVFLRSRAIKVIRDETFSTGEAECFALGSKIEIDELTFETGGGGTNTAVGFARQGWRTGFVGKIGASDARGKEILRALDDDRVDTSLVIHDRRKQSGYSVLLLTPRGERTALVYRGASADFQTRDFPWTKLRARWMYVSSLGGDLTVLRRLWQHARRHNIKIAWNPGAGELALGLVKLLPLIQTVDILSLNQEEAARLMNLTHDQDEEAFHRLRALVRGVTLVTQGTEGSLGGTTTMAWHCGTHQIRVVDTTGAGDAFGCGFVGSYIRHADIPRALRFGNENSESVIGYVGAKQGLLKRSSARRPVAIVPLSP